MIAFGMVLGALIFVLGIIIGMAIERSKEYDQT